MRALRVAALACFASAALLLAGAGAARAQYQLQDPTARPGGGGGEDYEEEDLEEEDAEDAEAEDAEAEAADAEAAEAEDAEAEGESRAQSEAGGGSEAGAGGEAESGQPAEAAHPSNGRTTRFVVAPPPPQAGDFQLPVPPIFHYERRAGVTTTAVFPAFYLRESPGTSELVVPPIYHREGSEPFDVVFPLFWWFRGPGHHTWIAGPVFHHEDAQSHDVGVAPLFMSGHHEGGRYYHLVPPLLFGAWGSADEDYLTAGLLAYRFRNRDDERWGLFPLLWVHNSPTEEYQFLPPLFWRWRNPELNRTLTILGPVYYQEDRAESFWGLAGLVHHDEGPGFHSTTIPPLLFHWSESPDAFRLSTPAFLYMREGQSETLVSWLYQRYRGATELDAVMPLFAHLRDPRDHSETLMVTPLVWHWSSPAYDNWAVAPFFLSLEEHGRSHLWLTPLFGNFVNQELHDETTWVLPTLQISRWHDGDAVNVHPLWYYESVPSHRFTVLNPLWWDFEQFEQRNRYTVAFPFYYRVVEGVTESQVTFPLATYFRRRQWTHEGRWEWELHVSGLFDYGERSDGEHWWRVLYGLVGWEHRIGHDRLWLLYLPIDFANSATLPDAPGTETSPAAAIPTFEPPRF